MSIKHSPGPWRTGSHDDWSVDGPGNYSSWHIMAGRKAPVAIVCEPGLMGNADRRLEANAYLIAAAPDLLEALRALQRQALQSPDLVATEWGQEALNLTAAAIAKAEAGQ